MPEINVNNNYIRENTSPNPSKGGEQARNKGSGDSSCVSNSPSFGGGWGEVPRLKALHHQRGATPCEIRKC